MALDPITVLTTISLGLKLVDQFRDLALRYLGKQVNPPGSVAEQAHDHLQIKHNGQIVARVPAAEMKMNEWDDIRVKALEKRVKTNWEYFNSLYSEQPLLSIDERARIQLRMARIEEELCTDFREMVRIYEKTLGIGLPDHYSLYEVCSN